MIILHILFRLKYLEGDVIKMENIYSIDVNFYNELYIYIISPFLCRFFLTILFCFEAWSLYIVLTTLEVTL